MEDKKSVITASILRSLLIPLLGAVASIHYKIYLFDRAWQRSVIAILFLGSLYFILKTNVDWVNTDVSEFVEDNYHSSFIQRVMEFFLRILQFVVSFIFKPLRLIVDVGFFIIPPYVYFRDPTQWNLKNWEEGVSGALFFAAGFVLCNFFLRPRETQMDRLKIETQKRFLEKYKKFIAYVYGLDGFGEMEIPSLPKDRIPSVLFYVFAFVKIGFFHLLNLSLRGIRRFKLQKVMLVLAPLFFIFEVVKFCGAFILIWSYFLVSFSLRILLNIIYITLFLIALYWNGRNLFQSMRHVDVMFFTSSLGFTISCFFGLEMIRHLILELPLRVKPDPTSGEKHGFPEASV